MGKTFEEIKSLIAIGGLTAVGYTVGAIISTCCDSTNMLIQGIGALIGAVIGIGLIIRRMVKAIRNI